jgi:acetyl-CoA synthetase
MRVSHPNDAYEDVHRQFGWHVPAQFNIAEVCCRRWARSKLHQNAIAIVAHYPTPQISQSWSFQDLQRAANRLSHELQKKGVKKGDRVAIIMPQRFETAVSYIAVLQLGGSGHTLVDVVWTGCLGFSGE